VMCHPGEIDDEIRSLDPVVETRPQELAFLLGEPALESMREHDVSLARLRPLAS
jgi:chitin disaccharide deacetylase